MNGKPILSRENLTVGRFPFCALSFLCMVARYLVCDVEIVETDSQTYLVARRGTLLVKSQYFLPKFWELLPREVEKILCEIRLSE